MCHTSVSQWQEARLSPRFSLAVSMSQLMATWWSYLGGNLRPSLEKLPLSCSRQGALKFDLQVAGEFRSLLCLSFTRIAHKISAQHWRADYATHTQIESSPTRPINQKSMALVSGLPRNPYQYKQNVQHTRVPIGSKQRPERATRRMHALPRGFACKVSATEIFGGKSGAQ